MAASADARRSRLVRLTLPAPTWPYAVGTVSRRLADRDRPGPWVASRPPRELMVGVRCPARDVERYPRAVRGRDTGRGRAETRRGPAGR
ncbi:hypothetical protein [Streptomyces sp. NPDC005322]|uniref:hypothetical protein n=1 Tax=Streptomyces sp. NPDC005322 TaxID=3157032 RepID=UPI0033BC2AD1